MADSAKTGFVEVVHATAERQRIVKLGFEPGMTARDAVRRSGLPDSDAPPEGGEVVLGIFGTRVDEGQTLKPGDRVEICRPLGHDPREMRRALLEQGRVMGRAGRIQKPGQGGSSASGVRSPRMPTTRSSSK